jgi:K+-transporting ATPase ATPase C chain
MKAILQELRIAGRITVVLGLLTCGVYPLVVTGIAETFFQGQAHGSLVTDREGNAIGSALIGQNFVGDRYFHPRPSAAGEGYDAKVSGGSNQGPSSQRLYDEIEARIAVYRLKNSVAEEVAIPADAVTASGSGLDPHISIENARLQSYRVASARKVSVGMILDLIAANTDSPTFGWLGPSGVNVLRLNLSLDAMQ